MSPAAGSAFGPYRLLRPIAGDAVTTTWFATVGGRRRLSRAGAAHVVVRIARRFDGTDEHSVELARQFTAQEQKAGVIDHPAIVRPHDVGVIDGHPYVATPFVRAVPLGDMLGHGGALDASAAFAMFAQLAAGLDAGHRAGVVHGAISPRSLWVGPSAGEGVAYVGYVIGFGTAPLLREHLAREPRGSPIDDVLYVAPEQLRGEPVTRATDQYSLACALYHTLSGRPPFQRPSRSKLYGAHLLATAPALGGNDTTGSEATSSALRRGMGKQPAERFASCGVMVNAALPDGGGVPQPLAHPPVRPGQRQRSRNDLKWQLIMAGVGAALAGVMLWFLLGGDGASSSAGAGTLSAQGDAGAPAAPASPSGTRVSPNPASDAAQDPPQWTAAIGDAPIGALMVVDGDVIAVDGGGRVAAVRPAAGRVGWRANVGDTTDVIAGEDVVAVAAGDLTALDMQTGDVRWEADGGPRSSLSIGGGAIVGAFDGADARQVLAVDSTDGSALWHLDSPAGDRGSPMAVQVSDGVVYAHHGTELMAVDPSGVDVTGSAPVELSAPTWRAETPAAWPLLAASHEGIALATKDGEICTYGASDGAVDWCEPVPGVDVAQPRVFATEEALIATTSEAIVALDAATGAPRWSLSPGSPRNLVTASDAAVVVADGDGGVTVLDARRGDVLRTLTEVGDVTALSAHDRWLVAGTADGAVRRFDIDSGT